MLTNLATVPKDKNNIEIWYLVLQTIGIILSICMVMGGIRHEKT